eukprot:172429-Ditylum_brightwellii.AAC.1
MTILEKDVIKRFSRDSLEVIVLFECLLTQCVLRVVWHVVAGPKWDDRKVGVRNLDVDNTPSWTVD